MQSRRVVLDNPPNSTASTNSGQATSVPLYDLHSWRNPGGPIGPPAGNKAASYAAAKAGVHGFTKSFAKEIGSRGITVNAVAPGLFLTDLTATLSETTINQVKDIAPIGRIGELPEVAYLVSFLASDKAAYITGEIIRIDGGLGIS